MVNNKRTISSIYAAGFKKEGIIRDYYLKDKRFIDGLKYSMLKKEFLEERNNIKKINGGVNQKDVIKIISKALEEEVDINSTMLNTEN